MTRDARQPPDVPRPRAAYSPVVVAGPLVFTAGQVAFGPDDTLVGGGVEEQTRAGPRQRRTLPDLGRLRDGRRGQGHGVPQ